tara:strand:- start:385 stop:786 length:402 start_codon:yes stop_codon:yes gene_type:complete
MKILGIEHIGIAVNSIKKDNSFWEFIFNNLKAKVENVEDQGVITKIYDTGLGKIELLEGLNKDSPINKFINKRGPGIHHISFEVEKIEDAISELKKQNIKLINEKYSIGAEGYKVVFIHPKSTGGVLVELVER